MTRNATRKGLPIARKSERRKPERMTVAEYKAAEKPKLKFRNVKTEVENIKFDSKREAERYQELRLLEAHGAISDLEIKPSFRLVVNNILICRIVPDFLYYENGLRIVEDVKSDATKTHLFKVKKKLLFALHGIEIREV